MNATEYLPLGGGLAGGIATGLAYIKPKNRLVDNIVMPIGGFIAGAQVGMIASSAIAETPVTPKLASIAVSAATLGVGVWGFSAWQKGKGHSDAGAVGIGFLAAVGTSAGLIMLDRLTTKLLPLPQLDLLEQKK